jgi:hypothetical protein
MLEENLELLFTYASRQPHVDKFKEIESKEEWLREVLLPSIEIYEGNTTGISLEAVVQSKEQDVSIGKEKQQVAKEQLLKKETIGSLGKIKELEIE